MHVIFLFYRSWMRFSFFFFFGAAGGKIIPTLLCGQRFFFSLPPQENPNASHPTHVFELLAHSIATLRAERCGNSISFITLLSHLADVLGCVLSNVTLFSNSFTEMRETPSFTSFSPTENPAFDCLCSLCCSETVSYNTQFGAGTIPL